MFLGRTKDLHELTNLPKGSAHLIVVSGRRRIGKSSLLQEYGRKYAGTTNGFIEISGLAPQKNHTNKDQLKNFAEQLSAYTGLPDFFLNNWTEAFSALAKITEQGKYFILLDEISWMGSKDKTFTGKLKIAWDKHFKNNPEIIVALCGSVSSWIEKNILREKDFVGRISWEKNLGPLSLSECSQFWKNKKVAPQEKLKILSVTGGVPKYLEEINITLGAEENIKNTCFTESGYLYNDFDKIFNDIFNRRADTYKNILKTILGSKLTPKEIAAKMGLKQNGDLTEYLHDLEMAGFVQREYSWNFSGKTKKLSQIRIKDNYIRFYLKYIEPNKERIKKSLLAEQPIDSLIHWNTIMGLQFENLAYDNITDIIKTMGIPAQSIVQYGSYFQTRTKAREGCQIDLLILSRHNTLYLCEIKCRKKIGADVICEVEDKIKRLKLPRNFSIRPCLIYTGEISEELTHSDYFDQLVNVEELLL
jgi:AAA+ ATPase superfamily predicted ATPase